MELISIRGNKIYLNFRYTTPSGEKARCREATGLENTQQNRIKAQHLALERYHALSHRRKTIQINTMCSKSIDDITFLDAIELYKNDDSFLDREEGTQMIYESYLRIYVIPYFQDLPLTDLSIQELKRYKGFLRKSQNSFSYLNKVLDFSLGLVRFAFREQLLTPFSLDRKLITPFKESKPMIQYLNENERDLFLQYIQEHEAYYYPVMLFTCYTGLRKGEIRALQWRHINLSRQSVRVEVSMNHLNNITSTKTDQIRTVYLTDTLTSMLLELKEKQGGTANDFVFVGIDGSYFKQNRLTRIVKRASNRAGIPTITFHSLRHTFGTVMANKNGLVKASKALGHSDIKTTMMYYHTDEETMRAAMNNL